MFSSHYDPRERSSLHRSTGRNPENELDYDNEAPARDDSREPRGVKRRRESDENRMVGDRTSFYDLMNKPYSFGRAFYEVIPALMRNPTRTPHPQVSGGSTGKEVNCFRTSTMSMVNMS